MDELSHNFNYILNTILWGILCLPMCSLLMCLTKVFRSVQCNLNLSSFNMLNNLSGIVLSISHHFVKTIREEFPYSYHCTLIFCKSDAFSQ